MLWVDADPIFDAVESMLDVGEMLDEGSLANRHLHQPVEALDDEPLTLDQGVLPLHEHLLASDQRLLASDQRVLAFYQRGLSHFEVLEPCVH